MLGTSTGWTRTLLNTVGLLWITAIVAGAYLLVVRVAERGQARSLTESDALAEPLGRRSYRSPSDGSWATTSPCCWSRARTPTPLLSDPFGRGWDLFGTYDHTIDYAIVTEPWVAWVAARR